MKGKWKRNVEGNMFFGSWNWSTTNQQHTIHTPPYPTPTIATPTGDVSCCLKFWHLELNNNKTSRNQHKLRIFLKISIKGRFQKKIKKRLDLSIQAGWLRSARGQNPTKKILFSNKNTIFFFNSWIFFIQRSAWLAGVRWALDKSNHFLFFVETFP